MVLAELGGKLRESLRKLQSSSSIDTEALNDLLSEISRALIESDVNVSLVMQLRENIKERVSDAVKKHEENHNNTTVQSVSKLVQKSVMDELTTLLTPEQKKPYRMKRNSPNVILFVGLQGAGKTTSIAKFANYYQRKGWKVAMVCADTFRAGAFDQLKQNATKLRVPFYGSYTCADPIVIAEEGVDQFVKDKYEIIIVDTSGRHKQEGALFEEMQEISAAVRPDNTVFVMDATQGQAVYDQALGFREAVKVGSVIVTKLDGHAKGGGALSAVAATQSPIIFLGLGEKFDEFELFNASSFVSKLLGYGDVRGFLEEMKEVKNNNQQEELMKKMSKGEFTLRDMYKQLQTNLMGSSGPMGQIMGGGGGQSGMGGDTTQTKKFMYMMDSMTDGELDGKVDWHGNGNGNSTNTKCGNGNGNDKNNDGDNARGGKRMRVSKFQSAVENRDGGNVKRSKQKQENKKRTKELGSAYKSKKAGGDVRKKEQKFEPYAFVPLEGRKYSKKIRAQTVDEMSTVVRQKGGGKRKRR
mmetsp:Transcript_14648/g.21870  ORF Transcript_14648/g.21870 Transcript_14648/m.21870 type:complete len:526 (+) Transcript_14648:126-1703(+)